MFLVCLSVVFCLFLCVRGVYKSPGPNVPTAPAFTNESENSLVFTDFKRVLGTHQLVRFAC